MSNITHIAVGKYGTSEAGRIFAIPAGKELGDGSVSGRDAVRLRANDKDFGKAGDSLGWDFVFTAANFNITKIAETALRKVSLAVFQNCIGQATAASGICSAQAAKAAALGKGVYATRSWDMGEGCPATQAGFGTDRLNDEKVSAFGQEFDEALTRLCPDINSKQQFKVV